MVVISFRDRSDGSDTRPVRDALDENGAGPTLSFAAAVLGARQLEFIAEHPKQRPVGVNLHGPAHAVDEQLHSFILDPAGSAGR